MPDFLMVFGSLFLFVFFSFRFFFLWPLGKGVEPHGNYYNISNEAKNKSTSSIISNR